MRKYEVMLILPADADDALVTTALDRITRVIGESQGEVTNTDAWGRRRLAFVIGKHTEGYYVVVDFTADPADEVVRFKVVQKPPERKRRDTGSKPAADAEAASPEPSAEDDEAGDAEAEADAETEQPAAEESADEPAAAAESDTVTAEAS
jgi:small subunit ribosomal protein S6